jgi:hypothetical protein
METIFNRRIGFFVLCLILFFWAAAPSFAKDDGSVSDAVAAARKAGVPEETVSRVLARGYEYGLKADEIVGFLDVTKTAQEKGCPLDPLVAKLEEGLAKRIEARNISRVLYQEIERFQFTRQLAVRTMNIWKEQNMELRPDDLARMAGTLAMGLTKTDMEAFFSGVPQAPMNRIANALEFMAGLVQAGLPKDGAREVVYAGIQSDFFSRPDWGLSTMARVAVQKDIPNERITTTVLNVVKGKMAIAEALQSLDLDPTDLQRGPNIGGPNGTTSSPNEGQGQPGGHGNDQGSGGSSGPSDPGGSGGSGGSGENGSGGGNGSGEPGGGSVGGNMGGPSGNGGPSGGRDN